MLVLQFTGKTNLRTQLLQQVTIPHQVTVLTTNTFRLITLKVILLTLSSF